MGQPDIQSDTPDDESPEADDAWFRSARPALDVLHELFGGAEAAHTTDQRQQTSSGPTDSSAPEGNGTGTTVPIHKLAG
ncbi:MAG: hypothetical protein RIQ53_1018 [Pseudomonadota bacterium]|jgi:hypothetical protein